MIKQPKKKSKIYKDKFALVMGEFAKKKLHGSDGKIVKNRQQAIAIALSEAAAADKRGKVAK